ncbi:MAG: OmpA family protein, partial [Nevskia sp.]|nr:OmpA family protein [Nevskia sp.]
MTRAHRLHFRKLVLLVLAGASPLTASAGPGWYVGAEGAANFVKPQDYRIYGYGGILGVQDGFTVGNATLGTGWLAGLIGGYSFENGFRGELSLDYRRNDFSKLIRSPITGNFLGANRTFFAGAQTTNVGGFENTDTLLLSVYYDFIRNGWFHPYIGIGGGGARVALRHPRYDQTELFQRFDTTPAFQGAAGVDFDLSDHWTASLDYRHLEALTSTFDLVANQPNSSVKATYHANAVGMGIRYSFGAPEHPAAPPPPEAPVQVVPTQEPPPPPPPPPCQPPVPGQPITLEGCKEGDVIVLRGVNFNFDKATLTVNAKTLLDLLADALLARPDIKFEIDGHTDGKGSLRYNQKLSERRADSVKQYLIGRGVSADRMTTQGFGKTRPIATNSTDEGRELNRRVELKITAVSPPPGGAAVTTPGEAPAAPAAAAAPADASAPAPA